MNWQFGRIDLAKTTYQQCCTCEFLNPVPVDDVLRVYREYCAHKHFQSVMPMLPGRLTDACTQLIGYRDNTQLVAWSMYRIWDDKNVLSDHFAWNYQNPKLRLGIRSLENECAIYRDTGYRFMYFESILPYMLDMQGFQVLGPLEQ